MILMPVQKPKVGNKMESWFSDQDDGMSIIIAVEPYTGRYKQWFTWTVRVTAPRTRRGWMETCL